MARRLRLAEKALTAKWKTFPLSSIPLRPCPVISRYCCNEVSSAGHCPSETRSVPGASNIRAEIYAKRDTNLEFCLDRHDSPVGFSTPAGSRKAGSHFPPFLAARFSNQSKSRLTGEVIARGSHRPRAQGHARCAGPDQRQ